jgi:hypothetical protein
MSGFPGPLSFPGNAGLAKLPSNYPMPNLTGAQRIAYNAGGAVQAARASGKAWPTAAALKAAAGTWGSGGGGGGAGRRRSRRLRSRSRLSRSRSRSRR